jgi:transposase
MNAMVMNAKGVPIIETWDAMKRRHFNERVEVLSYLAAGNLTYRQAATVLDVDQGAISKFIHRNHLGIKFKEATRMLSQSRRDKIARVLGERIALSQAEPRLTCKEAAKKLGVSRDCLKAYSQRHSIKWKPHGA